MERTWFITGINSGFGREMAEQLLAAGEKVAGTVRDPASVDDLVKRYGDRFWVARLDVTDLVAARDTVIKAFAHFGRIDVVVNNAGYGLFGITEGLTDEQINHQIETNLVGPIIIARTALPYFRAQGGGRFLVMSTYGGQATHPGAALYHASKWGLEGFFESLGKELAPFNIGVTIVEPGGARTDFRKAVGKHVGPTVAGYEATPVGGLEAMVKNPDFVAKGDPAKMVRLMIETVNQTPAPSRLVLGADSYTAMQSALSERLALIEAQKALAHSTDFSE